MANGIVDGAFCDLFEKYCRRFNEIETNKILFSKIKCLAQDKDILKELGVFGLKCNDPKAILQIAIPFTEQIAERLNVDITQRGEGGFIIPFYSSPGVIIGYFDLISPSNHRFKYICYYATGCSFSNINFIYDRNSLTRIYQWYLITDDPLLYIRSHVENYNKYKKFLPLSLFYKFFKLPFQHAFVHIPADIKLLYLRTKDYTSYSVLLCNIYNAYVLPVSENCTLSVSQLSKIIHRARFWVNDLIRTQPPVEIVRHANSLSNGRVLEEIIRSEPINTERYNEYIEAIKKQQPSIIQFKGYTFFIRDNFIYNNRGAIVSSIVPYLRAIIDNDTYIVEVRSHYGSKLITMNKFDFYNRLYEEIYKSFPVVSRRIIVQNRILRTIIPSIAIQLGTPEVYKGIPAFNEEGLRLSSVTIKWGKGLEQNLVLPAPYGPKYIAYCPVKLKRTTIKIANKIAKMIVLHGLGKTIPPIITADSYTTSIIRYVLSKIRGAIFYFDKFDKDYERIKKIRDSIDWPMGLYINVTELDLAYIADNFPLTFILNPSMAKLCWKVPVGIIKIEKKLTAMGLKRIEQQIYNKLIQWIQDTPSYMHALTGPDGLCNDDEDLKIGFPLCPHINYIMHNKSLDAAEKITGIRLFKNGAEANRKLFGKVN